MKKKLILVTSPPACGKTYISKKLAEELAHVVYLDKDTLIVLSNQIFKVAGQECNRSSEFFEKNIRDYEYEAILAIGLEALVYDDIVIINAPFTREIRDKAYIDDLRRRIERYNARLTVIWVVTDPEVCRRRMIERNSPRVSGSCENWDEYIKGVNFDIPTPLDDPAIADDLLLFYNSSDEEFRQSMKRVVNILEEREN